MSISNNVKALCKLSGLLLAAFIVITLSQPATITASSEDIYETEENNTKEEASNNMANNSNNHYGTLTSEDPADFWQMDMPYDTKLNLFLGNIPEDSNYNVYLHSENDEEIIWSSENLLNENELGQHITVNAGTYFVEVRLIEGGNDTENYLLRYKEIEEVVIEEAIGESVSTVTITDPIWPVDGSTVISDHYGTRGGHHKGVDISWHGTFPVADYNASGCTNAPCRSANNILSTYSGTVTNVYFDAVRGHVVEIESVVDGETLLLRYQHLYSYNVAVLDQVIAGDIIGVMGNTGSTFGQTGVHLHLEVIKNGTYLNPLDFVQP
ncbi:M23 family metallopeptidase [Longirhabdus pacifica]|uniref:M23 family metallopeptidase n=1 Tax=Longirhabdus pacifica TaxID=2305227 RepID=UPI00100892C1|nr:M23 family metallopeptidase [Longirhabdus pacifica]